MSQNKTVHPNRRRRLRLLVILLVSAGLLGAAFFFRTYYLRFPDSGTGPAGPAVPQEPFLKPWTDRQVMVLGLGDSITAGLGAPENHGFFAMLVQNPDDDSPEMKGLCLRAVLPNLKAANLAVSGTTSIQHADLQLPEVPRLGPNVMGLVVMTTGGNDLIHPYGRAPPHEGAMYGSTLEQAQPWIAAFEHRLDDMVSRIEACFPGGCHIFLANIYDPSDGGGPGAVPTAPKWPDATAILAAYNDAIARCALRHPSVHLVDIHTAFLGHGFQCDHFWTGCYRREDPHFWYYTNVEDPNARGHDAIRRLYLIAIAKAFGKMD